MSDAPEFGPPLLETEKLSVEFRDRLRRRIQLAVDDVDLVIRRGETVGMVGESGSGKTTIGRAILGLVPVSRGRVHFDGVEVTHASFRERQRLSRHIQVVFQDPYSSLNPTKTVGRTLSEPLRVHMKISSREARDRINAMLARVELPPDAADRYPSAFSGGQRQRIAIARALMVAPRLVICDEPVSALDLSVQANVLNLFRGLQNEFGLSYLFIAHDLAVVRHLSHRIVVLYRGRVVEEGNAADVYANPAHPYTRALLEAEPFPNPKLQRVRRMQKVRTDTLGAESAEGCAFASRCIYADEMCRSIAPALQVTTHGSRVACHHWRTVLGAAGQAPAYERRANRD